MLKPFSLSLLALACSTSLFSSIVSAEPLVIAHRGASGYLPEHTLEAKTLAYAMKPDYIEMLWKEDMGIKMSVGAIISMLIGSYAIKKIIDIKV